MLHHIADLIVSCLEKRRIIVSSANEREVYVYGFDIAIYTIVSTVGLLLIGFLFVRPLETFLLVCVFYLNQTIGGGYHANSHLSCFFVMVAGLLVFFVFLSTEIPERVCIALAIASFIILLINPVVLHDNKKYLSYRMPYFIRRSRLTIAIQMVIFFFIAPLGFHSMIKVLSLSIFACAVSRESALISRQLKST